MNKQFVTVCACLVGFSAAVSAQDTQPFQASLTPDVAVHERSQRIEGLTLSVWGENPQSSLAIGFVNGSTGDSSGLSWGFIANYADNYVGLQLGLVNYTKESMTGMQWGFLNYADTLSGLQLGFLNYAKSAESGVQVGFLNILSENQEWFANLPEEVAPGMIFVNWNF